MTTLLIPMVVGCGTPPGIATGPTGTEPTAPVTTAPYVGGFLEGEFCDVQAVFQVGCVVGCHSGLVPSAGLDLDTDPYGAIVGVSSVTGQYLVASGEPNSSFLYRKMSGDLLPTEGQIMPTAGLMDPVFREVVYNWIQAGAINDCNPVFTEPTEPTDYTEDDPYHPPGWAQANAHGVAANLQNDGDCRSCHGAQLDGGNAGVTCDDCHVPGWRTDCTYCHGGVDNLTGAPPEDIDNSLVSQAFPSHTEHVAGVDHVAYGCSECHKSPNDVLTPAHIFDDVTAGYGEVYYGQGLSAYATYQFGTCNNLYCHGGGQVDDGTATVGDTMYCYSCHPDAVTSQAADWDQMSGEHTEHLEEAITCSECHGQTTDLLQTIVGPNYHVDGQVQMIPAGLVYDGLTCTGSCHDHNHDQDGWN